MTRSPIELFWTARNNEEMIIMEQCNVLSNVSSKILPKLDWANYSQFKVLPKYDWKNIALLIVSYYVLVWTK